MTGRDARDTIGTMEKKKPRKPYKKPQVKTEKVFERKSLACGKSSPMSFACLANPKLS